MTIPFAERPKLGPNKPNRDFLSLFLHQLRTPLTAVQGTNYLLSKKLAALPPGSTADFRRLLGLQSQALEAHKDMLDQVQVLHRINRSADEVVLEATPVAPLIEAIVAEINGPMAAPRVRVEICLPPEFRVMANRALIDTAVHHLISNGLKFSSGTAEVRVELSDKGPHWMLSVSDHGCGIPDGEQSRVFEAFFRASNVGKVPGSGIGLAIVKRIAELHGGRVEFAGSEKDGMDFKMILPKGGPSQSAAS